MKWLVSSHPAPQVWRRISTVMAKQEITDTFDREQLWGWIYQLPAAGLSIYDGPNLRTYAEKTTDPAKAQLEKLASGLPQRAALGADATEAERDADNKQQQAERSTVAAELKTLLAGEKPLDAGKVLEIAARARWEAVFLGKDAHARKRVTSTLNIDQVATFLELVPLAGADRLDWLLDTAGVGGGHLGEVMQNLDEADLTAIFGNETRVKRLHKVIGDVPAFPAYVSEALENAAFKNAELRTWMLGAATPRDLFRFATSGRTADSVARACKLIGKDHGFGWVYELTRMGDKSLDYRRLALALPDRAAAAHLMKFGMNDTEPEHDVIDQPTAVGPELYAAPGERLRSGVASGRGGHIAAEAAELSDADRAAIRADRTLVDGAIASSAKGGKRYDAVRTARELDGNLAETIRGIGASTGRVDPGGFQTYARERPAAEQVEVASDRTLAATAETLLSYSPFNALPGTAGGLAKVLAANPGFVGWIERATDPVEAISRLGATPAIAEAAARAFEKHGVGLISRLQVGLTAEQRVALMRIGSYATKKILHEAVGEHLQAEKDNDEDEDNAEAAKGVAKPAPFGDVIDQWRTQGTNAKAMQAACNAQPHADVLALLGDPANASRIELLRTQLQVSPQTVFPWLTTEALVGAMTTEISQKLTDWWLATEEPVAVLRAIANRPGGIAAVAGAIDGRRSGATHWVFNLPAGFGLGPADEAALYAVYQRVGDAERAQLVFMARFGRLPDGAWERSSLDKLWLTLARLPDRQVEGSDKVTAFEMVKDDPTTDADDEIGGGYSSGKVSIKGDGGEEERYKDAKPQTKPQLAKQLGVDEAEIDRRVSVGLVEQVEVKGVTLFRIKPILHADKFTDTLLHEIGHAVDASLGKQTDLIFGQAGWKSYGDGDFDTWASDMGAWKGATVKSEDKTEIREAFEQRLRSASNISGPSSAFGDLVPSDHALKQPRNRDAFITKAFRSNDHAFKYTQPVDNGGRVFIMNHYYGRFFSYDSKIKDLIPLPYAGFAPEEFFAECYVEYYRDEANKGGNLPAWITTWFDANVDRIGHGPAKKP
jgi:hypothetical protein